MFEDTVGFGIASSGKETEVTLRNYILIIKERDNTVGGCCSQLGGSFRTLVKSTRELHKSVFGVSIFEKSFYPCFYKGKPNTSLAIMRYLF